MTTADDGAALAALTIIFVMMSDKASDGPEEARKVKDMLDRALLVLERNQMSHSSPATVALARSYIESLLQVVATNHPTKDGPGGLPS